VAVVTKQRCDHCYRWATTTVYRRGLLARLTRRPAVAVRVCSDHLDRYRGQRFKVTWRRGR